MFEALNLVEGQIEIKIKEFIEKKYNIELEFEIDSITFEPTQIQVLIPVATIPTGMNRCRIVKSKKVQELGRIILQYHEDYAAPLTDDETNILHILLSMHHDISVMKTRIRLYNASIGKINKQ